MKPLAPLFLAALLLAACDASAGHQGSFAACKVASTLSSGGIVSSERSDLGMAVFWYRRARQLGSAEAEVFLQRTEIAARSRWNSAISPLDRNYLPRQFLRPTRRTHAPP